MELRGDKVKEMRLARNWTQQQLADICDLNMRTIQRVETKGSASLETIMALCVAFNTQRETFFEVPTPREHDAFTEVSKKSVIPALTFILGLLVGVGLSTFIVVFN